MAKPVGADLRWATGGTAALSEPSAGLRDTGFVAGTQIDEGYVNKLLKNGYLWQQYLDTIEAEDHAWTGANSFSKPVAVSLPAYGSPPTAVTVQGASVGSPAVGDGGSACYFVGGSARTSGAGGKGLVAVAGPGAGLGASGDAISGLGTGASGSGGVFAGGSGTGNGLTAFSAGGGGIAGSFVTNASGIAARFADASGNGRPIVQIAGYLDMSDGYGPPSTQAFVDIITRGHFPKAVGSVSTAPTDTATVNAGHSINITSASCAGAAITVTMAAAMSDSNYVVHANVLAAPSGIALNLLEPVIEVVNASQFKIRVADKTDALQDLGSDVWRVGFTVYGQQA